MCIMFGRAINLKKYANKPYKVGGYLELISLINNITEKIVNCHLWDARVSGQNHRTSERKSCWPMSQRRRNFCPLAMYAQVTNNNLRLS